LELLPLPEIESGINAERTEGIGNRKVRFPIIVGMEHYGSSHKVFGIIIHNSCTGNQIKIDILNPTFISEVIVVYLRFLIPDTRKKGKIGYPVLGKYPIIPVPES
jgi:hypothetical protein